MADASPNEREHSESSTEVESANAGATADSAAVVTGEDADSDEAAVEPETRGSDGTSEAEAHAADADEPTPTRPRMSHVRLAMIAGLVLMLALGGLTGWLGFNAYKSHKAEERRNLFIQVGRQGALNLTTIDWQHAEGDVQRILNSATGTFYDDFQRRAQPFIAVVKQAQSKSVGDITEAGLKSGSENEAEVLVAVTVNTSNARGAEQQPRSWRMRITVQKVDNEAKVSNVEFVP